MKLSSNTTKITRRQRILIKAGAAAITAAALLVAAGSALAPWLASQNSVLAHHLYRFYGQICHQVPSRSFVLFGHPMAACGRCVGIYFGFLAGCLAILLSRKLTQARLPRPLAFGLMSLPLALDALANFLGIWDLGNGFRLATGLIWGLILPFFAVAGLADLVRGRLAFGRAST